MCVCVCVSVFTPACSSVWIYCTVSNVLLFPICVMVSSPGYQQDRTSVPGDATMAYYLKPLTYNSQIAGYLIRSYPGPWTVVDASGKTVLATYRDDEILVPQTNTPDLRASVRRVQKDVDERAIRERSKSGISRR